MKAIEFLQEFEVVQEIERLPATRYGGGKAYLSNKTASRQVQPLPGGSGLLYSIVGTRGYIEIKLYDPGHANYQSLKQQKVGPKPVKQRGEDDFDFYTRNRNWERAQDLYRAPGELVGKLEVEEMPLFPIPGAVQVSTITVDEDYRGQGLAKALYGIVLTIMKRPLLAGDQQTPGGRKNWVSLSQIPGVEMKGYFTVNPNRIATVDASNLPWYHEQSAQKQNKQAEKIIDTIMSRLGGQYIGQSRNGYLYWAFDVAPNTTKQELESAVNTKMSRLYGAESEAGLYAVWTGK